MDHLKIFDKKYSEYLEQIKALSLSEKSKILGIQKRGSAYIFEFFNRQILFDQNNFRTIINPFRKSHEEPFLLVSGIYGNRLHPVILSPLNRDFS